MDGFMNIGYTDNGDWLSYKISVPTSGNYNFSGRYSGTSAGKFDVYADDVKKGSISTTNTSGWQNWASASTTPVSYTHLDVYKRQIITNGNMTKSARPSAVIEGNQVKGANRQLNSFKTNMYLSPEMTPLKR